MTDEFDFGGVSPIAYNFDKWLQPLGHPPRGRVVVPEPSTEAVVEFWRGWTHTLQQAQDEADALIKDRTVPEDETPTAREERMLAEEAIAEEMSNKLTGARIAIVAALCQGTPSADELTALPFRVRRAFEMYLAGKLGPEA